MASYRGLPTRFVWGDAYDKVLDVALPLDEALAYPAPREGSEWVHGVGGAEDSWIVGRDYYLRAKARRIPFDGTTVSPLIGRRHSGWDDADGWRAMLEWARAKNPLRFYPDARNLLTSPAMATDSNADGVVDNFAGQITPGIGSLSFDPVDGAQMITVTAGSAAGQYGDVSQQVFSVLSGEPLSLSIEYRTASLVNAHVRIYLQFRDANNAAISTPQLLNLTGNAYSRAAVSGIAPAGTASVRVFFRLWVTGAAASGQAWFRNAILERAGSASAVFIDQPGYRPVYLVEPMSDPPESEKDYARRVPLLLRAADRAAFVGY